MDRRELLKNLLGGAAVVAIPQAPKMLEGQDDDWLDALAEKVAEKVLKKFGIENELMTTVPEEPRLNMHGQSAAGEIQTHWIKPPYGCWTVYDSTDWTAYDTVTCGSPPWSDSWPDRWTLTYGTEDTT